MGEGGGWARGEAGAPDRCADWQVLSGGRASRAHSAGRQAGCRSVTAQLVRACARAEALPPVGGPMRVARRVADETAQRHPVSAPAATAAPASSSSARRIMMLVLGVRVLGAGPRVSQVVLLQGAGL